MSIININLVGTVKDFKYSHECREHKVYTGVIDVKRESGVIDSIPFFTVDRDLSGSKRVRIDGNIRTYNYVGEDGKNHKKLYVRAVRVLDCIDEGKDANIVEIKGAVVKILPMRETPLGKKICDFMIAVNYNNKKSAYINSIAWGKVAERMSYVGLGEMKTFFGRLQSREYLKETDKGMQRKTAMEISISWFEDIENDTCCD